MKFGYGVLIFAIAFVFGLIVGSIVRDHYHFSAREEERREVESEYKQKLRALQSQIAADGKAQPTSDTSALREELTQVKAEKTELEQSLAQEQKKREELEQQLKKSIQVDIKDFFYTRLDVLATNIAFIKRDADRIIQTAKGELGLTSEQIEKIRQVIYKSIEELEFITIGSTAIDYTYTTQKVQAVLLERFKECLTNSQYEGYKEFINNGKQSLFSEGGTTSMMSANKDALPKSAWNILFNPFSDPHFSDGQIKDIERWIDEKAKADPYFSSGSVLCDPALYNELMGFLVGDQKSKVEEQLKSESYIYKDIVRERPRLIQLFQSNPRLFIQKLGLSNSK